MLLVWHKSFLSKNALLMKKTNISSFAWHKCIDLWLQIVLKDIKVFMRCKIYDNDNYISGWRRMIHRSKSYYVQIQTGDALFPLTRENKKYITKSYFFFVILIWNNQNDIFIEIMPRRYFFLVRSEFYIYIGT